MTQIYNLNSSLPPNYMHAANVKDLYKSCKELTAFYWLCLDRWKLKRFWRAGWIFTRGHQDTCPGRIHCRRWWSRWVCARKRHGDDRICCRSGFVTFVCILPVLLIAAYFFFCAVPSWRCTYAYFHNGMTIQCPTVRQVKQNHLELQLRVWSLRRTLKNNDDPTQYLFLAKTILTVGYVTMGRFSATVKCIVRISRVAVICLVGGSGILVSHATGE